MTDQPMEQMPVTHNILRRVVVLTLAVLVASVAAARAQGVQTGTISGVVRSMDGLTLPGVTVVATSPQLQGARTAVSDEHGVYSLRGLLPGTYRVAFDINGFRPSASDGVVVTTGSVAAVNSTMAPASVTESVIVTAPAPNAVTAPRLAQTFSKATVDTLAVGRRPIDVAELAPNLTTSAFNVGHLSLGGSFGFDNVFMVNGVDINDNVAGTSNTLFIEDAIQETSVLSHGISAEWGRFSGGVISVVTKSGGNQFSGSFRETLSNPTWITQTPLERAGNIKHVDVLSKTHEGTVGGPIVRDRIWFFSAARAETANSPQTFAQNGGGYTRTDSNRRGEVKVTGTPSAGQTLQASFIENATKQTNATFSASAAALLLDSSMLTTRELPNRLFVSSYNGAVSPKIFASVQYSAKHQSFSNNGGTSSDIRNSPFRTAGVTPGVPGGLLFNAPYLDATDPEQRNNQQITGSAIYALTDARTGTHELKAGVEHFISTGVGGNSQSSTGYVFFTDYLTSGGAVVRDQRGTPVPVFIPGATQIWSFQASRGAEIDTATTSLFFQDRWMPHRRVSIEAGTRIERARISATGNIVPVETWSIVPRVAASYDLTGRGKTLVHGTYGHYSGKYTQVQFGVNTTVGRPSEVDYVYAGPAGEGRDFTPGFSLANYSEVTYANFPTSNVKMADGLHSPLTKEFTVGLGQELGRGHVRATYVWRRASDFVEDFATLEGGITQIDLVGPLTNRVYDNTSALYREYQAVTLQSGFRLASGLAVDAHYTGQLRNHGTYVGEAASQPGIPSIYGNFPEVFAPALDRLMPEGRLDNFQRHKLRVFGTYTQSLGRAGSLDVSPLWRVNSGNVYSLTAAIPVPVQQLARNPGYPAADVNAAARETVFFGERGDYQFKGYGVMDLAATYSIGVWRSVRPWFKVEVFNLLNNQKQIGWDRTVTANRTGELDVNGIPTGYIQGARFGQATAGNHFPQPYVGQNGGRATRMLFGVRF